ncbi:MAG: permease [Lachnospiraceae bacterium]|nr:permease [Lachnospiraceae bacterium]
MDFNIAKVMVFVVIFAIMVFGYLIGSISVKGVTLGTAGVFLVSLVYGHFAGGNADAWYAVEVPSFVGTLGLIMFVSSVGFIAGPTFFKNLVKNAKSYVLLGFIVIMSGALACVGCILVSGTNSGLQVGILSGALTTTPGFSAAKEAVADKEIELSDDLAAMIDEAVADLDVSEDEMDELNKEIKDEFGCTLKEEAFAGIILASSELTSNDEKALTPEKAISNALVEQVSVGHGVAYPFGVVGIVLFVQILPKLLKVNMDDERKKLVSTEEVKTEKKEVKLFNFDEFGLTGFALAIIAGLALGSVSIPLPGGAAFSLGSTGGPLIMCLIFGHFGRIGKFNISVKKEVLEIFREFGLVLFLVEAGVEGGAGFVDILKEEGVMLFVYGIIMTCVPMIVGYLVARYILKLSLLNNLGSLTGGMTSTPALGTLISVAGTANVASAYAATYPIALVVVVLASQFIVVLL